MSTVLLEVTVRGQTTVLTTNSPLLGNVSGGGGGSVETVNSQAPDGSGNVVIAVSNISGLQAQIDGKAASTHSHAQSDVTGLSASLSGKADSTHSHAQSDVTGLTSALSGKADTTHTHAVADTTGLQTALDDKADIDHAHTADDVLSGQFGVDLMPPGTTITIDYTKAMFGSAGNAWPSARPTARTDIIIVWKGPTDPGSLAIDGDDWQVTS